VCTENSKHLNYANGTEVHVNFSMNFSYLLTNNALGNSHRKVCHHCTIAPLLPHKPIFAPCQKVYLCDKTVQFIEHLNLITLISQS